MEKTTALFKHGSSDNRKRTGAGLIAWHRAYLPSEASLHHQGFATQVTGTFRCIGVYK